MTASVGLVASACQPSQAVAHSLKEPRRQFALVNDAVEDTS